MAEPVSFVIEKLYNLVLEEVTFLHGVREQVEWVEGELRCMQAFLQDADAKQANDRRVVNWVSLVREIAYDAEDVVDRHVLRMHQQQRRGNKRYACLLSQLIICHNTRLQIEDIKSRIEEIPKRRITYSIDVNATQEPSTVENLVKQRRESDTQRDMNVFVGFEDDIQKVVNILLDGQERRSVISIVGMGGSGKTTLARRIFNHDSVKIAFGSCRALASVSQTYNLNKILEDIAKMFLDKEKLQQTDEKEWKKELFTFLEKKRYLIILDDVWHAEVWDLIQFHIPDDMNGSRVMITTRTIEVAKSADPCIQPYELRLLRDDESWDLFSKIAFPSQDASTICTGELEKLGRKIVKRCGGLPLAVAVMAGFVSTKPRTPTAWHKVLQGFNWEDVPSGESCMQILALSYRNLPYHLKPCFLYLSCFPEEHKIDAGELIRLWVAEGLVSLSPQETKKQGKGGKTLEDVAENWLEELIQRCLLQHVEWDYDGGRVLTIQIHDLLLDLCRKQARESNFFHIHQDVECLPHRNTRRLALHPDADKAYMSQEFFTPKLRTFLAFFSNTVYVNQDMARFQCLKRAELLRVINLENAKCRKLPAAIGDIVHLRFLGLRSNDLRSIPSTVGKLQNLQTLDVRFNFGLNQLPNSVWGVSSMRHMFTGRWIEPQAIVGKQLVNLQTLEMVKAGDWIQKILVTMRNLRRLAINNIFLAHHHALAKALDNLPLLRCLQLSGEDNAGPLPRKALALPKNQHLERLILRGTLGDLATHDPQNYTSEELPPNLCFLTLFSSNLQKDPFPLFGKLSYLKVLKLELNSYVGEELVCSADSFPQLKQLELSNLYAIRRWRLEKGGMPCLDDLTIVGCRNLEELPELQHVRTLRSFKIEWMSERFLWHLREGGKDWYKVQHIPSIYFGTPLSRLTNRGNEMLKR